MSKYNFLSLRWKLFTNAEHTCSLRGLCLVTSTSGQTDACFAIARQEHRDLLSVMFFWANVQADRKVTPSSGVLWSSLVFAKVTLQLSIWI